MPDWLGSIDVVETPRFLQPVSPGASMESPRLFAKSANGYYFITPPESLKDAAERLDMNEDFDRDRILSTAAHEAMPGHFLQLSIARRHSDYIRKIQYSGMFAEGWAFYGEEMFVRLGLYGDDLDARLFTARWERVRGARVMVDVKLASGEWTLAQAAKFFEEQSGFTKSASEAAVAGYALRPGYVLAYTVGRLQLEQLLAEYQRRTGDKGSLRDFHDRLLSYGSMPFPSSGRSCWPISTSRPARCAPSRTTDRPTAAEQAKHRRAGRETRLRREAFADSRRCGAALGAAFTAVARAAWVELYGVIARTMLEGASEGGGGPTTRRRGRTSRHGDFLRTGRAAGTTMVSPLHDTGETPWIWRRKRTGPSATCRPPCRSPKPPACGTRSTPSMPSSTAWSRRSAS